MSTPILIVDDDPHILEVIGFALQNAGFSPHFATDGKAALADIKANPPKLLVLDIGLPEMDGLELCREVRKFSDIPILFLSARDEEIDRVIGLEIGGDDYVTKPFSPRELVARVKTILKRTAPQPVAGPAPLQRGALMLDPARHLCRFSAQDIPLTVSEFSLLAALLIKPENVLSRAQLMEAIYGQNIHVSARTIDSHIRNIRAKLAGAGCKNGVITVHGVGLRMGACLTA